MPLLDIRGLQRSFYGVHALDGVDLAVEAGTIPGLIGSIALDVFMPLITLHVVLALGAGGTGNNWGAVVGAFLVVFFMEGTRFATGWMPERLERHATP